ncbi:MULTISPECIES: S24/S26 family peptidase [Thermobacillus]|jgi:hypothetical protein|nr:MULTISPECIES: S24/S26 family peptidase [Thermobacillus]
MHPLLRNGQTVNVLPVRKLRIGDIVLYRDRMNRFLAHRIIEISGDWVVTAGDRNKIADPPIAMSEVLGIVELADDEREAQCGADWSPVVYMNPAVAGIDDCRRWSESLAIDIVPEPDPFTRVDELKKAGSRMLLIHPGARRHVSELPPFHGEISIFIGYEAGRTTDRATGTIGVTDVTFVARASTAFWQERDIALDLGVAVGFGAGRRRSWLG